MGKLQILVHQPRIASGCINTRLTFLALIVEHLVQVIDHAATIKQLQTADAAVSRLEEAIDKTLKEKTEAEAKQVSL